MEWTVGSILLTNELSNLRYAYTNLNHNCKAELIEYIGEYTISVRILEINKEGRDYLGNVMTLETKYFDLFKPRSKHYISPQKIKDEKRR